MFFSPLSTSSRLLLFSALEETLERHFSESFSSNLSACVWGFIGTREALWYPELETRAWETGRCVENRLPVSDALPAISAFPLHTRLVCLPVCSDMAHELACFSKRIVLIWNWQRGRKYFPNWGWLMEGGERGERGEAGSWVRGGEGNRSEEREKTLRDGFDMENVKALFNC